MKCVKPTENFPYRADTFELIKKIAPMVNFFSRVNLVPPVAVAGAIADEYNTRTFPKSVVDWFQDEVLLNWMPSSWIELDAKIGSDSKFLNATKHDIGIGNIKIETAKRIYETNKQGFGKKLNNWSELVDYLRTPCGSVHIASLVIRKGQSLLANYINTYSQDMKEAVLVTYYKQGPSYVSRYLSNKTKDTEKQIFPGEGCRVYFQREKIKAALGI